MTTKTLSRCNIGDLVIARFTFMDQRHGYVSGPNGLVRLYQPRTYNFITFGFSGMMGKDVDVIRSQDEKLFRFDKVTPILPIMGLFVGVPYTVRTISTDHMGLKMVELTTINNKGLIKVPASYLVRMPSFNTTRYNNTLEQLIEKVSDLWSKKRSQ